MDMTTKKRIVIKVGTSTLTHKTGRINIRRVEKLVKTLADLHNSGREIILVSSGSIGLGMSELGIRQRPKDIPTRQACAAVGQCELMYMYDNLFSDQICDPGGPADQCRKCGETASGAGNHSHCQ